jgi:hypothetical protein
MDQIESDAARIAALEQQQRRLTRQVRWLLIIAILLTALASWQQLFNCSLVAQNEGLIELIRLMEPFHELDEPHEPPTTL